MASNKTTLQKKKGGGEKQNRKNKKVEAAEPEEFVVGKGLACCSVSGTAEHF